MEQFLSEFSCSLCSLLQADEGRCEEAHSTPGELRRASSCSLCSLLQADEGRREEVHLTPGEERAVSFLN